MPGTSHRPRAPRPSTQGASTGRIMTAEEHAVYVETMKASLASMRPEVRAQFVGANRHQPWASPWVGEVDQEAAVKSAGGAADAARAEHDAYIAKIAKSRGVTPQEAERALHASNDLEFRAILGRWHESAYAKALGRGAPAQPGQAVESVSQKELRTHVEAIAKSRGVPFERAMSDALSTDQKARQLYAEIESATAKARAGAR